jgi:tetratricopeptide (TPR) repeat protein
MLFAQEQNVQPSVPPEIDKLIQSYQFKDALTLLDVLEDSLSIPVLQRKGLCYQQLGNYGDAIEAYEGIVGLDSVNTTALIALGQLYGRQKQYGGAFICYSKLIKMDSLNSFYYKQYGIAAVNANLVGVAVSNFFKALELNPRDVESTTLLAELLIDSDLPQVADTLLRKALSFSSSPHLTLLLARAQLEEKKYKEAIKTTQPLLVNGDTLAATARLLGVSYFKLSHYEESLRWMKFLEKKNWKAESIYYYIAMCYQNLNKPDSAITYMNMAIEEGISENIGIYYHQLAISYEAVNNFRMAIKYYKAAYEESRSGILLYHLARNYDVYYKDKAQAIAYFKKYLESDDTIKLTREYSRARVNELEFYR